PQVQVGDPFTEKLLLEATLELIEKRLVVAIQDMGAAGLTSSSAEMAARGGVGVEIETDKVPIREAGMTPYEIMLSESQERMLVVAEPSRVREIQAVCEKWELTATPIGRVTDDGLYRIRHGGVTVAEIPGEPLVEAVPIYHPESKEDPAAVARRAARPTAPPATDLQGALPVLLDEPSIASKRWVFEQYDSTVQAATLLGPGGDAGLLRVADTDFGLAVTVDCNSRLVALDPFEGGKAAVAEAARNIAVTGAVPLGITDCLNFGNPERPAIFFQFKEACRGIAEACRAFNTPVTGGNVSLYNESPTGAVDPTPTIGMVGLLEKIDLRVPSHFQQPGDRIVLLGAPASGRLGGSAYWAYVRNFVGGEQPVVDLPREVTLQKLLAEAARRQLLRSAHDCSTGGLAVALAEAAIGGPYSLSGLGAEVAVPAGRTTFALDEAEAALLYGEDHARVVASCDPANEKALLALAKELGVPASSAGVVGPEDGELVLSTPAGKYRWGVGDLRGRYFSAIPRRMSHVDEDRAAVA
ncbi:MAG TPA: AIR synthase-related protein, partial [Gemmatimonadales bacterium]|nr:AIR synthase-related protein [Gemmatimonadales bacterium]